MVDDTDESNSHVQLELEQSYVDDVQRMAEINHALGDNQWAAAVKLCDEALAARPRWSVRGTKGTLFRLVCQ